MNDNNTTDADMIDDPTAAGTGRRGGFPKWLKWGLFGALAVLIVDHVVVGLIGT